jgi:hypothetical protein
LNRTDGINRTGIKVTEQVFTSKDPLTQGKKQAPLVAFKSQLKSDIYNEKNYNSFSARTPAPVQRDISALKSTVD